MTVAFELQDRVDDVFQHAGPGKASVLGDMAHQDDRDVLFFGDVDESLRATSYLADAARQRGKRRIVDGLNRVDHDHFGARLLDCIENVRE